jgi:hypothetical protein
MIPWCPPPGLAPGERVAARDQGCLETFHSNPRSPEVSQEVAEEGGEAGVGQAELRG